MRLDRGRWVIAALGLVVVGAACAGGADDPASGEGRTAAVYETVLGWMLDDEPDVGLDQKPEWALFVVSRSEDEIDLDVQVAVVDALDHRVFVRFIDERSEAVEADSDDESVRDGGLLIGLGAVTEEGDTVELYADRYRDGGDVDAWLITLERAGARWEIVGTPSPADVRPLPGDG